MCCAGEYWVVGVDTEQYDTANPEKYLKALLRDETNPLAQRAFRSYLGVVPSPHVGFENFSERVNYYMERAPFCFPNPLSYLGGHKTVSVARQARMRGYWVCFFRASFLYSSFIPFLLFLCPP
jgi:hypothetical protein